MRSLFLTACLLISLASVSSLASQTATIQSASPASDWRAYGRDFAGQRFSSLAQINRENVGRLTVAWRYHAGHSDTRLRTAMECTPLVIEGVMYVTSPVLEVIALDAATGRELWKYNPFPEWPSYRRLWIAALAAFALFYAIGGAFWRFTRRRREKKFQLQQQSSVLTLLIVVLGVGVLQAEPLEYAHRALRRLLPDSRLEQKHLGPNRGLTYWSNGSDRRIFFAGGHRLVALNAQSGRPIPQFGRNGVVELTEGLSRPILSDFYTVTSPGVICRDVLVLGSSVAEGPGRAAPGDVRGFDVRTGKRVWTFHTIPTGNDPATSSWPAGAATRTGGVNAWAGMIADEKRGLVFVPLASPTFDYYGGDRLGNNLYSDSLVAIHAETGQPAWHYQVVRHDLWDYDLPCPPVLATVQHNGRPIDAVVQPTKQGFVFVLNADTGESLFPVRETPVPPSSVPGEVAAATQPFPLLPPALIRLTLTEADLTTLSDRAHADAVTQFRALSGAGIFLPPSRRGTLVVPGFQGGVGWGGASFDPIHARLLVNTNELPYRLRIVPAKPDAGYPYTVENFNDPFIDAEGYPAIKPPWGKLSAINLNSGQIEWQVPLGEFPALTRRGIPPTGTNNIGGSLQTATGIAFIAATKDRKIRAFDAASGQTLWSADLSAAGHATPATYAVGGRQFVVIAAGGGSIAESTPSGDEYIAFSLPQ